LSIAKINRKGLAGERSGLFYEYLRILRELKPRYFVLENVASMPKEARETITKEIGVEPVLIDAGLVSAQRRKRLFWTNIPLDQPADRGIFLKDVLQPEEEVDEKYYVSRETLGRLKGWKNAQSSRIHGTDGKSVTLQAGGGGTGAKTGLYAIQQRGRGKNAGNLHTEKSPTLTSNAFEQNHHVVALTETRTPEAKRIRAKAMRETGKDWSPRRGKELVPRKDEKANTLTTGQTKESLLLAGGRVRKLTPIECERLQSVPDNYTAGHADGSRYKMLGNAFNVEVIRHILSKIK
jgi:DNA (cytosine-5)-methyltransferase 3A